MTGPYQNILTDTPAPHVLRVTLNRPDVANAFNTEMMRELLSLLAGTRAATPTRRAASC